MSGDVLENAIVSCGSTPRVVLGLQAVYGNDQVKRGDAAPFERNGSNRAGDDLDFDLHGGQLGKEGAQFAVANQRFAADDGKMQGFEAANEREDRGNQCVATEVTELAERASGGQVVRFVSVTAGTAQRAFFGDFEREEWPLSAKNFAPGWSDVFESHGTPGGFDAAGGGCGCRFGREDALALPGGEVPVERNVAFPPGWIRGTGCYAAACAGSLKEPSILELEESLPFRSPVAQR